MSFFYVCLQWTPHSVINAIAITQAIWLILTVYAEPYERKYLRLSVYTSETLKLLIYVALTNFSEKYVNYLPLVSITNMIYLLIVLTFTSHTLFILMNIIVEYQVYWQALKYKLGLEGQRMRIGGYAMGKLRIYPESI
jgi:hypothetical protein